MLGALGWFGFQYLTAPDAAPVPEPSVRPSVAQPAEPAAAPASAPATTASGPVAQTRDAIAAVEQGRTAAANEVLASATPTTTPSPAETAATTPVEPAAGAATAVSPAPIPVEPEKVAPPPSPAFRAWVDGLRISGVRAGASPRVFIERTAYSPGDLVNPQLGITFEGYNAETRKLSFKDRTGAVVERRH